MASLSKIRGTFKHGNICERLGLLGTFLKNPDAIDHVYFVSREDGSAMVSISRSMWQNWTGLLSAREFDLLTALLGSARFYSMGSRA